MTRRRIRIRQCDQLSEEKVRDYFRDETRPALAHILQTLVTAAVNGDVRAALAILHYHAPPSKEPKAYGYAPDLSAIPIEQRSEEIARLSVEGVIDLDTAERLMRMTDTPLKQQNISLFLSFLRKVGQGSDPAQLARTMAARLANETTELH